MPLSDTTTPKLQDVIAAYDSVEDKLPGSTADDGLWHGWKLPSYAASNHHTVTFYDGNAAYDASTPQAPQTVLDGGTAVQPSIPVKTGFRFNGWKTADGADQAFDFTTPITADTNVYASWIPDVTEYHILSEAEGGGSISPEGNTTVNAGANQTFTITPDTGYHIKSILVDSLEAVSDEDSAGTGQTDGVKHYTFSNVQSDHTIKVIFEKNEDGGDTDVSGNNPGGDNNKPGDGGNTGGGDNKPGDGGNTGGGDNKPGDDSSTGGGDNKPGDDGNTGGGNNKPGDDGSTGGGDNKPGDDGSTGGGDNKPGDDGSTGGGNNKPEDDGSTGGGNNKPGDDGSTGGGDNKPGSDSSDNDSSDSSAEDSTAENNNNSGIPGTDNNASAAKDSAGGREPKTGDTYSVKIYATIAMIAGLSYLLLHFADHSGGMTEEEKNRLVTALISWAKKGSCLRRYAALSIIFLILVYYHSIGKHLCAEWKTLYKH